MRRCLRWRDAAHARLMMQPPANLRSLSRTPQCTHLSGERHVQAVQLRPKRLVAVRIAPPSDRLSCWPRCYPQRCDDEVVLRGPPQSKQLHLQKLEPRWLRQTLI